MCSSVTSNSCCSSVLHSGLLIVDSADVRACLKTAQVRRVMECDCEREREGVVGGVIVRPGICGRTTVLQSAPET